MFSFISTLNLLIGGCKSSLLVIKGRPSIAYDRFYDNTQHAPANGQVLNSISEADEQAFAPSAAVQYGLPLCSPLHFCSDMALPH